MSSSSNKTPTVRLSREVISENERLRLLKDNVRFHSGRENVHWKVDYKRDGVGVVPVADDGRVILGLHYRYCTECWGWEIAAGGVEPDEDHDAAAKRELIEETGHDSEDIEFLTDYHPAPGLGNEHFFIYVATNLTPVEHGFDAEEIYETRLFTWSEVEALIGSRELTDGFSLAALCLARTRGLIQ